MDQEVYEAVSEADSVIRCEETVATLWHVR